MSLATIIDSLSTRSVPPYIIVKYEDAEGVAANSDSSSLIELELPGLYTSLPSYIQNPKILLTEQSYMIDLASISLSCLSTNFGFKILNRNDISLINSIYSVNHTTGYNLNGTTLFTRFPIRNRDVVLNNKIYLYIENSAGVNTGTISIELIYLQLQDREF